MQYTFISIRYSVEKGWKYTSGTCQVSHCDLVNKEMLICPQFHCSDHKKNTAFIITQQFDGSAVEWDFHSMATVVCCDAIMALFAKDYTIQGHEAGCETCGTSVGTTSLDIAQWTQPERFSHLLSIQQSNNLSSDTVSSKCDGSVTQHTFFSTQKLARAFEVISKAVLTFLINCGWLCKHLEYSWLGWKFKRCRWSN